MYMADADLEWASLIGQNEWLEVLGPERPQPILKQRVLSKFWWK